jgi:8-oxo-dGTP pyrophosphatase MutT (NUDIX family)
MKERIRDILSQRERRIPIVTNAPSASAAVLVPLYHKEGECHILFTKRTEKVEHHKGQISFPGGALEPDDGSLMATALRETFEEIGVRPEDVEILGELDDIVTVTSNFLVTPFVGLIPFPYEFTVSADEIEYIVEVPIAALLDRRCYRQDFHIHEGLPYWGCTYQHKDKVIWGATARILKQFLDLVFGEDQDRS